VHGDGVCVVLSDRRGPGVYVGAVAVNDLIMLVAFAPIVMFLCGVAHVVVPAKVLITSVVVFIVIPLAAGWVTRTALLKSRGKEWFEGKFLPKFHPVMIGALLVTAGADFRVPGGEPDEPVGGGAADRGADSDPGVFQLGADLHADAVVPGAAQCGGAGA